MRYIIKDTKGKYLTSILEVFWTKDIFEALIFKESFKDVKNKMHEDTLSLFEEDTNGLYLTQINLLEGL